MQLKSISLAKVSSKIFNNEELYIYDFRGSVSSGAGVCVCVGGGGGRQEDCRRFVSEGGGRYCNTE